MIGVYLRVSTEKQDYDSQRVEIERYLEGIGNPDHVVYAEKITGSLADRPEYTRMIEDAKAGKITHIVSYALDRVGRNPHKTLIDIISLFYEHSVEMTFVSQPELTKDKPMFITQLAIRADIAHIELQTIRKRIRSGLAAARKKGKRLGRPDTYNPQIKSSIIADIKKGVATRAIIDKYSISERTFYRLKKLA